MNGQTRLPHDIGTPWSPDDMRMNEIPRLAQMVRTATEASAQVGFWSNGGVGSIPNQGRLLCRRR